MKALVFGNDLTDAVIDAVAVVCILLADCLGSKTAQPGGTGDCHRSMIAFSFSVLIGLER